MSGDDPRKDTSFYSEGEYAPKTEESELERQVREYKERTKGKDHRVPFGEATSPSGKSRSARHKRELG